MSRKSVGDKPKFDPSVSYSWDPEQEFTVLGKEIDLWNKTFNILARDPQFERFLYLQESLRVMTAFFAEAVEEGAIKAVDDGGQSIKAAKQPDLTPAPKDLSKLKAVKGGDPITEVGQPEHIQDAEVVVEDTDKVS